MIRETRFVGIGIVGVLLVVAAGVLLRDLAGGLPVGPDAAWQALMSGHRWAPAVSVARVMAWIGNTPGVWIVTAALVIVELALRRWRAAIALLLAVDLSSSLSSTIKLLSVRPRPTGGLDLLTSFSFPSGHTTWAAAVAVSLTLALPRVWTWVLAGSWTAFMAWSRTYLGVHWLSDVAAGALLGVSVALLATGLVALLAPGDPHSTPAATITGVSSTLEPVSAGTLLRRGRALEWITLGWNVVGVIVLAVLAVRSSSVALAGFGLDSFIEIGASAVVLWELSGTGEVRQQRALRIIGVAFLALAGYLMVQSVIALVSGHHAAPSGGGIVWTAVTAAVMFTLAALKSRTGRALGNPVLETEGRVTFIDGLLAVAVLLGIALDLLLGWWWADPLAGLVIVFYAVREAVSIFRGDH